MMNLHHPIEDLCRCTAVVQVDLINVSPMHVNVECPVLLVEAHGTVEHAIPFHVGFKRCVEDF